MILSLSSFSHGLPIAIDKKPLAYALQIKNYYMKKYFKGAILKILR